MGDRAERVHLLALQEDVHLHEIRGLLAVRLPVQGRVAPGLGLELVEEVEDDLRERQPVAQLHAVLGQVVHALHLTRLDWESSMTAPMNSEGTRIVAETMGSRISRIRPSGNSDGLVTSTSEWSSSVKL